MNRDSSVSIVTGQGMDDRNSILGKGTGISPRSPFRQAMSVSYPKNIEVSSYNKESVACS